MTPLGWRWAGFVWAYAVACFLINDRVKLLAYRIFDPTKAPCCEETGGSEPADRQRPMSSIKSESMAKAWQIRLAGGGT